MTVTAHIVRVEPTSEYQGTVYSQRVVAELADGTTLGLFDPNTEVSPEMVGSDQQLQISILVDSVDKIEAPNRGVVPSRDEPEHWHDHTYIGDMVAMAENQERPEVEVDFGFGTLGFNPSTDLTEDLAVGDTIRVTAQRSDVNKVIQLDK